MLARWLVFCLPLAVLVICGAFSASAENSFSLGAEGFRDRYLEPEPQVDTHSDYGAVTANYTHEANHYFSAVDGRYSWGSADYKSPSGTLDGTPEFETDTRLRTGIDIRMWHGRLMPYMGLGWRYYFDEGKGGITSLGKIAYDRHISQIYIPVGTTYNFSWGSWDFAPNLEIDPLAWGRVSSHFRAIGGQEDLHNTQKNGYGIRGEFMVGQQYKSIGWQVGPFIRYWKIKDSDCVVTVDTSPLCGEEPENSRLQTGAELRVNF